MYKMGRVAEIPSIADGARVLQDEEATSEQRARAAGLGVMHVLRSLANILEKPVSIADVDIDIMDRYLSGQSSQIIADELQLDAVQVKQKIDQILIAIGQDTPEEIDARSKHIHKFTRGIYDKESVEGLSVRELMRKIVSDYPGTLTAQDLQRLTLFFEGMSHEEIANQFGIRKMTIQSRFRELRGNLFTEVNSDLPPSAPKPRPTTSAKEVELTELNAEGLRQFTTKWGRLFDLDDAFVESFTSFLDPQPLAEPANPRELVSVGTLLYAIKKLLPGQRAKDIGLNSEETLFVEELFGWYEKDVLLERAPRPLRQILFHAKREGREFVQTNIASGLNKLYKATTMRMFDQ